MGQTEIQIVVGIVLSFMIQWAKKTPWFPLITERTDKVLKVAFSAVVAAGAALAISFNLDPTLGQLVITGLTWSNVGAGLLAFLKSFLAQQFGYRLLIQPKEAVK